MGGRCIRWGGAVGSGVLHRPPWCTSRTWSLQQSPPRTPRGRHRSPTRRSRPRIAPARTRYSWRCLARARAGRRCTAYTRCWPSGSQIAQSRNRYTSVRPRRIRICPARSPRSRSSPSCCYIAGAGWRRRVWQRWKVVNHTMMRRWCWWCRWRQWRARIKRQEDAADHVAAAVAKAAMEAAAAASAQAPLVHFSHLVAPTTPTAYPAWHASQSDAP